jgi:hypothetical protein
MALKLFTLPAADTAQTLAMRERHVTVLPFRHLPGTSAFKPLPTWYATGAERIGSE